MEIGWRRFERRGVQFAAGLERALVSHRLPMLALMLGACGLAMLVGSGASLADLRLQWAWKFRRRRQALDPRAATLAYGQFLKAVGKRGFRKLPAQTPQEFAAALAPTPLSEAAAEFTRLYNSLRFGSAPVPPGRLWSALDDIAQVERVGSKQ